jgi:hypothetical protein
VERKTVHNWIISQLKVAPYSSPTTAPIKDDEGEREKDAEIYESGIFSQFFSRPIVYVSDGPGDQPQVSIHDIVRQKRAPRIKLERDSK